MQAVEAEVAALLDVHADKLTDDGHRRLVRHGHLPEREIMTGIALYADTPPAVEPVAIRAVPITSGTIARRAGSVSGCARPVAG